MLYLLYRIGEFLALSLPRRAVYAVACALADVYSLFSPKERKAVADNLRIILGDSASDKELKRMSREIFRNFAKYLVDFFSFSRIDKDYINKIVKMEGLSNIDEALSAGKGVIMLSAHMGNWELGGAALGLTGYQLSAVVLTHRDKRINDFFNRQRMSVNFKPIEFGMALKGCYRTLRENGLLALLGDRDFTKNGITMDFFGHPAFVPKGPAIFSHRIGSAIVPCFMIREIDDNFTLFIEKPIYPVPGENEEECVTSLTKIYLAVIESYVRRYPEQWYIFKNIWDNKPEAGVYR